MSALPLLLSLALLPAAADQPPNQLTAAEIAEGWLLLFDGTSTFGWKTTGSVQVVEGNLVVGGEQPSTAATLVPFSTCNLAFECRFEGNKNPRITLAGTEIPLPQARQAFTRADFVLDNSQVLGPLVVEVPAGCRLSLRNARLKPLGLKPLLNGKDLSNWRVVSGSKADFSVDPQGQIIVRKGPGDLQTEGQWANFILQLDVLSLGQQRNSGILIRSQPGQYGTGYEVQIRNQWQGNDPTRAVDFGTGGIHGHAPARKVVARDGEWFTATIMAVGKRLAVWINGYPVCDFEDRRPVGRTATQGAKIDPGPIAIHGDDRNLDLRLRNVRLFELPAVPEK